MTGADFILRVKAKLNRLDSAAYEDIYDEEIYMYAHDALKNLTIKFDSGIYSGVIPSITYMEYLRGITKVSSTIIAEAHIVPTLFTNKFKLPRNLGIKDAKVMVTIAGGQQSIQPCREWTNEKGTLKQRTKLIQSYPDQPAYQLKNGFLEFKVNGFHCDKLVIEYLEYPVLWTDATDIELPFMSEFQDVTVGYILENLEQQRVQTQQIISKN